MGRVIEINHSQTRDRTREFTGSGRTRTVYEPPPLDAFTKLGPALRKAVRGEVRFDDGSRALYATDASNYRQVPIGVVIPRSVEDVVAAVRVCRDHGAPIVNRGG